MSVIEPTIKDGSHLQLVLVTDPPTGFRCPLCSYHSTNLTQCTHHMWKFREKNSSNKSCRGKTATTFLLYPRIFCSVKLELFLTYVKKDLPAHDWKGIRKCFTEVDYTKLITDHNFCVSERAKNLFHVRIPNGLDSQLIKKGENTWSGDDEESGDDDGKSNSTTATSPIRRKRTIKSAEKPKRKRRRDKLDTPNQAGAPPAKKQRRNSMTASTGGGTTAAVNGESEDINGLSLPQLTPTAKDSQPSLNLPSIGSPVAQTNVTTSPTRRSRRRQKFKGSLASQSVNTTATTTVSATITTAVKEDKMEIDDDTPESAAVIGQPTVVPIVRPMSEITSLSPSRKHTLRVVPTEEEKTEAIEKRILSQMQQKTERKRTFAPLCASCRMGLDPTEALIECIECSFHHQTILAKSDPSAFPTDSDGTPKIGDNDISLDLRVLLCQSCYAHGTEFDDHRRFHLYRILPKLDEKLFDDHWTMGEEWALLQGVARKFGIGNWKAIAQAIPNKNAEQCEEHFISEYLENETSPFVPTEKRQNEVIVPVRKRRKQLAEAAAEGVTNVSDGRRSASPPTSGKTPSRSGKAAKKTRKKTGWGNSRKSTWSTKKEAFPTYIQKKVGYNPNRMEFEAEWNNDGEAVMSEMVFSEWDTADERALKHEAVRIYNEKLDERERRRKFIVQYGVNSNPKVSVREIYNNLAPFRLYAKDKREFNELINGLLLEQRIRAKISRYQHYILNGITSSDMIHQLEHLYIGLEKKKAHFLEPESSAVASSAAGANVSVSASTPSVHAHSHSHSGAAGMHMGTTSDKSGAVGATIASLTASSIRDRKTHQKSTPVIGETRKQFIPEANNGYISEEVNSFLLKCKDLASASSLPSVGHFLTRVHGSEQSNKLARSTSKLLSGSRKKSVSSTRAAPAEVTSDPYEHLHSYSASFAVAPKATESGNTSQSSESMTQQSKDESTASVNAKLDDACRRVLTEQSEKPDVTKLPKYNQSSTPTQKVCSILGISPRGYSTVEKEVTKRVLAHGLLRKGALPQHITIDIGDPTNVNDSSVVRIGYSEPHILTTQLESSSARAGTTSRRKKRKSRR